jgi:uncharacterized protein (TIGR02453 family)
MKMKGRNVMKKFEGFTPEMNDYLMGIRFNNYKSWFDEHREQYTKYVHEPMKLFADEIFARMNDMDEDFREIPKISRANRDIRFSKNKNPYKESKWFFLRGDGSPHIVYSKPTYFFEVMPECWRYGFFYEPGPNGMAVYRKKIESDIAGFERLISEVEKDDFFITEERNYKRVFNPELSEHIRKWHQKKGVEFTRYEDYTNTDVYSEKLIDVVFEGFKRLYPLYKFFNSIKAE